jgi:tyrosine recombinase XerC
MEQLIQAYVRYLTAERNLSAYTLRNYRSDLSDFGRYLEGEERIGPLEVDRQSFRRYLARLHEAGTATASVSRKVSTIHTFYRYLVREGHLERDPLMGVSSPKRERRLPKILGKEQLTAMIEAADSDEAAGLRDRAILELMYAAGLRLAEAVSLDVTGIDLPEHLVRVRGKGNKERMVVIGRPAAQALHRYVREGRPELAGAGETALFVNRNGKRLSGRSMQKIVRKHALMAGLDQHVFPHLLRHSFATHMLDGGAELRVVQELLGHASADTTQIYTHVTEERQRRVYDRAFYNQVRLKARLPDEQAQQREDANTADQRP